MAQPHKRKSEAARQANETIKNRTILLMVALGIFPFIALFFQLYDLQINQHAHLQELAVSQQTASTKVTASRGTIFDKNGNVLAISATAETVFADPAIVAEHSDSQDIFYIARGLGRILEMDEGKIIEKMTKTNSQYEIIALRTELGVSTEIRQFLNGEIDDQGNEIAEGSRKRLYGVYLSADSKRYYPYGSLASHVIGFVGTENKGMYGLESQYESTLQGTAGLTVTAQNARGSDLLYQYEQYYDAQDGQSLVLTLDSSIQHYVEKGLEDMVAKFDAKNGATGLVMDVNTGGILAMASYPTYDLNSPSAVYAPELAATLAGLEQGSDAYWEAVGEAQMKQWRSKILNDTYEPGSTYKPITLAAALEEGKVNKNTTFNCTGSVMVPGWNKPIWCSNHYGHGIQDLMKATGNSCNPAFISMGFSLGADTYYEYMKSFGLMEKTGLDIIGETQGIVTDKKTFTSNQVGLASYSFGQTFTVTPLQLIRAQAATVNGGYLYTPHVVEQVLDGDGNIVEQHDTTPVRQVISEETSKIVRECLEYVVAEGTGKNGQVAGYRIGGKTGTADKTGDPDGNVVVSFMCFAPADDPQVMMLLTLDSPSRTTGTYVSGGNMVAPTSASVMAEILMYMGVEPDYGALDDELSDATVPNVVGKTLEEATEILNKAEFSFHVIGDGDTVTDQTPDGGAIIPHNAELILYLGAEEPTGLVAVPNVVGLTAAQANKRMSDAGLIVKVFGTMETDSGNVYAIGQSLSPDTQVEAGTVVTVQFGDTSVLD